MSGSMVSMTPIIHYIDTKSIWCHNSVMETKMCSMCKQEKPLDDFYPSRRYKSGRVSACKSCFRIKAHKYLASPNRLQCSAEGCSESVHARGFCTLHYQRWKKNGAPILSTPRTGGTWNASPVDLAYIAGFMDGEGTIGMKREQRRSVSGGYSYQAYITAANTDPVVIEWLYSLFGGNIRKRPINPGFSSPNAKPHLYVWAVGAKTAVAICELLLPYLRMKRRQAEILLEACGDARRRSGRVGFPQEHWDCLEQARQQLKELNQRGVKPDAT